MEEFENGTQYMTDMQDEEAFTFGYAIEGDGKPIIGKGSDEDLTILGIATSYMIRMLRYAKRYVLHVGTTYKLNQSGSPVLVIGVSDQVRSFHPVGWFITSQQTGDLISSVLASTFDMYKMITKSYPVVLYCMDDADKAQFNAIAQVTSVKTHNHKAAVCLICVFHLVKNVADRNSKLPIEAVSLVFKHLYQMHYAHSAIEFTTEADLADSAWAAVPALKPFAVYFKKQWVDSQFANWGCYHISPGYAKTNNPVEQFNNAIKRDYSLRTPLNVVVLAKQLSVMSRHRSRGTIVLSTGMKPNRELQDRDMYLRLNARLSVIQPHKDGLDFLLDGESGTHIAYVYQRQAPPRLIENDAATENEKKKLGKRNKHRMELWEQPVGGWIVGMMLNTCPCRSWYKYQMCVHVLAALRATGRDIPGSAPPKTRFVNRRRKREERIAEVGSALVLE